MNGLRVSTVCAVFACGILSALASVGQDPGVGQVPLSPLRIQGPAAGPLAPPMAPDGAAAGSEPLKFKMYALLGQVKENTAATLGPDMKPIEGLLKGLPYTEYERISIDERVTPEGVETQFPINPVYSLVVLPNGQDGQGAAKLDIHVDLMQDGKLIKALTAQAAAKPGDALLLRGMPLPPGEMVIVLQRDAGDQKSQGGQSEEDQQKPDQQDQPKPDKDSEAKKDDSEKKQDEKKEEKEAEADQEKDKQEQASPEDAKEEASDNKDSKNLESILQSLEEVDRKEQAEVRNKRDRIDFKGDWW